MKNNNDNAREQVRMCKVCKKKISLIKSHSNTGYSKSTALKTDEGFYFCSNWFCNDCYKKMDLKGGVL